MYIDTHCHLNFPQYDADRAMVIGNAKKAGVKKFINPGVNLYSSSQAIALAQKHPGVIFAAVGIHPYEAQHDPEVRELEKLLSYPPSRSSLDFARDKLHPPGRWPKIVAIGECGLDYHQYKGEAALGKKDKQKRLFTEQVELALKHDIPVIFHSRDAFDDFFNVLNTLPSQPKGVIHCFSGGLQEVRQAQERGFLIGIDGNLTYSKHLQSIIPHIPLSMMLLETDAPYLTPVPHRGTRNEAKYIPLIAKKVAELLKVSVTEVEEKTTQNAKLLFGIS